MKRGKRILIISAAAFSLYILSIGPVFGILSLMKVGNNHAEHILRVIYKPLGFMAVVIPTFNDTMKWYIGLFCSPEANDVGDPSPNPT